MLATLEATGANSLGASALLDGAEEAWGLGPCQPVLLTGSDVKEDRILNLPEQPVVANHIRLAREGTWLVSVEHSGSMWAALCEVENVACDQIDFGWSAVDLPGADPITLGHPRHAQEPFSLIAPPPRDGAFPARLGRGGVLLTAPFRLEKGQRDSALPKEADRLNDYLDFICDHVTPCYRYGLLVNGVMRWLDVEPGFRSVTATPTTALFRERLALLGRELAARGIYYEDDAQETGYELRHAIEDSASPSSFYEPNATLAFTVSGELSY